VDLSTSPATIHTREQWPLRYAAWQLLVTVVAGDPERGQPVPAPLPPARGTRVYLTVNTVAWLGREDLADIPKCISRNRLTAYRGRRLPRSAAPLLLDSGGTPACPDMSHPCLRAQKYHRQLGQRRSDLRSGSWTWVLRRSHGTVLH
jgi:hypothetical protein